MKKRLTMFLACLFLTLGSVFAQNRISGIVISAEDDQPVIGASVIVQGQRSGTITDADGRFTISVPAGKKISISFIGMETQTLTPKNGMRVVLHNSAELEEVVVTGMQKVDKRLFTGATTKVDASDAKIDGIADISRSLEGRAAGVTVQNVSGTFGTAPKIRVRGATSIYGSSKPLWVIDGVIMEDVANVDADDLSSGDAETLISSAVAGLNADDIESFQILKDGSATSIYGARAMAGVIVVTTKKGKAGQHSITYTGEYTLRLKPSYSTFNIMNSQDQMAVYQELEQKGLLTYASTANAQNSGVYGKMYQLLSQYDATTGQFGLANTPEAKAAYLREAEYRNTDWFDELFNVNIMHNHSVSISSGTDKAQYYASVSAMYDPGWTISNKVQRYTANLNSTFNLNKKLSLNMIANASYRKQESPGAIASESDVVNGSVDRGFDINPYSYALNTSRTLDPDEFYTRNYTDFNIKHELSNNYIDYNVSDLRIQGRLNYKPIRKLELSALIAIKYNASTTEHNVLDDSNQARAYRAMGTTTIMNNNRYLYTNPDDLSALPITVLPEGGILDRTDTRSLGWDFRGSVNYNDVFAGKHIVNFYGGMETNSVERRRTWFRGWGMQYSKGETPYYVYELFKKNIEDNANYYSLSNYRERSVAFFANASYSWKGRYTLNGTFRYEGTNKLGKSRSARWMPTWNISGAWNAHEEPWFKNTFKDVLTHGTLRLSYSLTGDRGPSFVTNSADVIYSGKPWRPFTTVRESYMYISRVANYDLTYEKKHEFNVGVDLGFLKNRINVTFEWYKRNNYDLIGYVNVQGMAGETQKPGNVAEMRSHGCELSISTTNIKNKNFSWTTNFIYSHTSNKVTKLLGTSRIWDLIRGSGFAKEGYPVRSIFSVQYKGLDGNGIPQVIDNNGKLSSEGTYFQDTSDGAIATLVYSGPADPTDTGSLGNIFKWKGLTLNCFITYSYGNVVRLDRAFSSSYSDLTATPNEFKNRWVVPGDERYTDVPGISNRLLNYNLSNEARAYNSYNYSDARIAKGDFIRMKEISIAYDFPKKLIRPLSLKSLSLKLQATNLFLIYADKKLNGQDPEFVNSGGVAMPIAKQFTATLRIGM
ncbi:MAG: SusC/RagA family TonB-linked outer membrane protein [Prevotella sp.]|nr:SusC/RagA family TonB-linked outer membrane protein [Prevotella sp.]